MTYFDATKLTVSIDAKGIAWITYPGPPYTVWQMVEVDDSGKALRRSSGSRTDLLWPIFKARSMQWMLCVQYVAAGEQFDLDVEGMGAIAEVGINALFTAFPTLSTLNA